VTIQAASIFEIVRLAALHSQGEPQFYMLVDSREGKAALDELNAELETQTGETATVINAEELSVEALIKRLHSTKSSIVIIYGLENWTDKQFVQLDVNRSRLETGAFIVIKIDINNAGRLLDSAPNLRSYIGTSIFAPAPDLSSMGPEEVEDRLEQLRTHYKMSDAEVIEKAIHNDLPLEPHFAEWLVLLNRSELIG
jgi:hypothetical protein